MKYKELYYKTLTKHKPEDKLESDETVYTVVWFIYLKSMKNPFKDLMVLQ